MAIQIGRPKPTGDVVDALLECHERIRRFSATACRLAEAVDPEPAEVAAAAEGVRRYFVEALPRHVADEDESILPRLKGRNDEVDRELDEMAREHREHGAPLDRLIELCVALAQDPSKHAGLQTELGELASQLQAGFEVHLEREERVILPAMRTLLDEDERAAISQEMKDRRLK